MLTSQSPRIDCTTLTRTKSWLLGIYPNREAGTSSNLTIGCTRRSDRLRHIFVWPFKAMPGFLVYLGAQSERVAAFKLFGNLTLLVPPSAQ